MRLDTAPLNIVLQTLVEMQKLLAHDHESGKEGRKN